MTVGQLLICQGCPSEMPKIVWLKNQKCVPQSARRSQFRTIVSVGFVSSEVVLALSCCLFMWCFFLCTDVCTPDVCLCSNDLFLKGMGQIGSESILTTPLSNNYLIRSSLIKYSYILGIGVML